MLRSVVHRRSPSPPTPPPSWPRRRWSSVAPCTPRPLAPPKFSASNLRTMAGPCRPPRQEPTTILPEQVAPNLGERSRSKLWAVAGPRPRRLAMHMPPIASTHNMGAVSRTPSSSMSRLAPNTAEAPRVPGARRLQERDDRAIVGPRRQGKRQIREWGGLLVEPLFAEPAQATEPAAMTARAGPQAKSPPQEHVARGALR